MPSTSIIHVFVSPGAIRLVSIRSGNGCRVLGLAEQDARCPRCRTATGSPSGPGRSATTFERIARTFRGSQPARSGRWSACMPRSPRQPYSPLQRRDPLPVDRLARVEVARVEELRAHLEHAAVAPLGDPAADLLAARDRTAAPTSSGRAARVRVDRAVDRVVRGEVDPERLLAEQVLARVEDGDVELLVQVVRDRAVDGLDRVVGEQVAVVGDEPRRGVEPLEPARARPGSCRRRGRARGRTPRSARWIQRAAALASSRPISPPPITPKRTTRSAMHDRHQPARHPRGSACWITFRP